MQDIEFNDGIDEETLRPGFKPRVLFGTLEKSPFINLLKKSRLAKTDKQAYYILFTIACVFFIAMILTIVYYIIAVRQAHTLPENIPSWLNNQQPLSQ